MLFGVLFLLRLTKSVTVCNIRNRNGSVFARRFCFRAGAERLCALLCLWGGGKAHGIHVYYRRGIE